MKVKFSKYQGTGNDFILIDNRTYGLGRNESQRYKELCHRNFGIGADGLILLNNKTGYDFEMVYFNSDGRESTMCGNGGRCIVRFASNIGIGKGSYHFAAIDGGHEGHLVGDAVSLRMIDVNHIGKFGNGFVLNTGSPHFVEFTDNVSAMDVVSEGRRIRSLPEFPDGINVNFVQRFDSERIFVRTYERGVEDETLSCGTGVVATALVFAMDKSLTEVNVETPGGCLSVRFRQTGEGFTDIYLTGKAEKVFDGELDW